MVRGNALKDAGQRVSADRIMIWDDLVMFTADLGRDSDMRTFLSIHHVTESAPRFNQLRPGYIAR